MIFLIWRPVKKVVYGFRAKRGINRVKTENTKLSSSGLVSEAPVSHSIQYITLNRVERYCIEVLIVHTHKEAVDKLDLRMVRNEFIDKISNKN